MTTLRSCPSSVGTGPCNRARKRRRKQAHAGATIHIHLQSCLLVIIFRRSHSCLRAAISQSVRQSFSHSVCHKVCQSVSQPVSSPPASRSSIRVSLSLFSQRVPTVSPLNRSERSVTLERSLGRAWHGSSSRQQQHAAVARSSSTQHAAAHSSSTQHAAAHSSSIQRVSRALSGAVASWWHDNMEPTDRCLPPCLPDSMTHPTSVGI